jgi:hypothetical protein
MYHVLIYTYSTQDFFGLDTKADEIAALVHGFMANAVWRNPSAATLSEIGRRQQ